MLDWLCHPSWGPRSEVALEDLKAHRVSKGHPGHPEVPRVSQMGHLLGGAGTRRPFSCRMQLPWWPAAALVACSWTQAEPLSSGLIHSSDIDLACLGSSQSGGGSPGSPQPAPSPASHGCWGEYLWVRGPTWMLASLPSASPGLGHMGSWRMPPSGGDHRPPAGQLPQSPAPTRAPAEPGREPQTPLGGGPSGWAPGHWGSWASLR